MRAIFSHRCVEALAKTIVLFGILHLGILTYLALHGDVQALNAFAILDLHHLLPGLGHGAVGFLLSYCMVLGVYCCVYVGLTGLQRRRK